MHRILRYRSNPNAIASRVIKRLSKAFVKGWTRVSRVAGSVATSDLISLGLLIATTSRRLISRHKSDDQPISPLINHFVRQESYFRFSTYAMSRCHEISIIPDEMSRVYSHARRRLISSLATIRTRADSTKIARYSTLLIYFYKNSFVNMFTVLLETVNRGDKRSADIEPFEHFYKNSHAAMFEHLLNSGGSSCTVTI